MRSFHREPAEPRQLVLDAGALISLERGGEQVRAVLKRAADANTGIVIPAGVLAQAWRSGRGQVRLARLLNDPAVDVICLNRDGAKAAGAICGRTDTSDVIDASVIVAARTRPSAIVTSDPDDLRRLDPSARLIAL